MENPTHNFEPGQPALCVACGGGGEGVYYQRGVTWYWDGRNAACNIQHLAHLKRDEMLAYGRKELDRKYRNSSPW